MKRAVMVAGVMYVAAAVVVFFLIGRRSACAEPRWVDPCTVNPERCTRRGRQQTPQERFEARGLPAPESRDRIYRWNDEDVSHADIDAIDDAAHESSR